MNLSSQQSEENTESGRKEIQAPSLEQWKALYDVAASIKAQAPWEFLYDWNIITLELPGREEPVFFSIMGRGQTYYGVGVYPGNDAFKRLKQIMQAPSDTLLATNAFEQDCLVCVFGSREDIEPEDRDIIKKLGLRFRGKNQWIYFRALTPGYSPRIPDTEQADLLLAALQQLVAACNDLKEGSVQVDFDAGKTLHRFRSEQTGEWMSEAAPMPSIPITLTDYSLSDQTLLARLRKMKKIPGAIEVDYFYLPSPVRKSPYEMTKIPIAALCMDRKSGFMLDQHMSGEKEEPPFVVLKLVSSYILSHGRPAAIYVRDERVACILRRTCREIGIRLVVNRDMRATDAFIAELLPDTDDDSTLSRIF